MLKDIPGYEGKYAATEDGKVWSYPKGNHNGKFLKHGLSRKGYAQVNLLGCTKQVHRLIAITFIPNPENKPQVNHIDGVKLNNDVSNFEWATNESNMEHAVNLGLYKTEKARISSVKNGKSVNSILKNKINGKKKRYNTFEFIENIRKEYIETKCTQRFLALKYNIGYKQIWKYVHNIAYREA